MSILTKAQAKTLLDKVIALSKACLLYTSRCV